MIRNFDEINILIAVVYLIIITIGIIGSIFNLIIFNKKSFKRTPSFRFLFYLSIIDLLVLIICKSYVLIKLVSFIDFRLYSNKICKIHTFLVYYLTHISSILLMIVSIERTILICNNLSLKLCMISNNKSKRKNLDDANHQNRRYDLNKKFQVEKIMILLLITIGFINCHLLFFFKVNYYDNLMINLETPDDYYDQEPKEFLLSSNLSTYEEEYRKNLTDFSMSIKNFDALSEVREIFNMPNTDRLYSCSFEINSNYEYFFKKIWIWIDMMIYSVIPFIVMLITSIVILIELNFNTKRLSRNTGTTGQNKSLVRKRNRRNNQLLIMLMATNIYFLICSLPYFIGKRVFKNENHSNISLLIDVLYYSNNSLNFIIYFLFSQKYRLAFYKILKLENN